MRAVPPRGVGSSRPHRLRGPSEACGKLTRLLRRIRRTAPVTRTSRHARNDGRAEADRPGAGCSRRPVAPVGPSGEVVSHRRLLAAFGRTDRCVRVDQSRRRLLAVPVAPVGPSGELVSPITGATRRTGWVPQCRSKLCLLPRSRSVVTRPGCLHPNVEWLPWAVLHHQFDFMRRFSGHRSPRDHRQPV